MNVDALRGYFDVVCLFQVIEHMDRLESLFQRLDWLTRNDASLFISVPNPKLIEFAELNGGLLDMPPNHIGRWQRECFETIGQRWGWKLEGYEIEHTDFMAKAILFGKYRFWRKSQDAGTLAHQISRIKSPQQRKLMQAVSMGLYALADLPKLKALRSADLGFSQWVHLKKME